jgi:GNAT superfamily N-acetyltransferase
VEEIHRDPATLLEMAMGPEASLVRPRFARGCRCFAVLVESAVAGYGWLSTQPEWIGELQLEIQPRKDEAYIWNCATVGEHRRRGVFRALLAGISELARKAGLKRLWIGSVAIPAEKAVGPSGFKPAVRFVTGSLRGLQIMRVQTIDPNLASAAYDILKTKPGIYIRRRIRRMH